MNLVSHLCGSECTIFTVLYYWYTINLIKWARETARAFNHNEFPLAWKIAAYGINMRGRPGFIHCETPTVDSLPTLKGSPPLSCCCKINFPTISTYCREYEFYTDIEYAEVLSKNWVLVSKNWGIKLGISIYNFIFILCQEKFNKICKNHSPKRFTTDFIAFEKCDA